MGYFLYLTPYAKYHTYGPQNLSDVELLAIIIRNGTKTKDAIQIADDLLSKCDSKSRIVGLMNVPFQDLIQIDGIGEIKAMCIGCILELGKRLNKQSKENKISFNCPSTIADCYMEQLRHLEHECVLLLLFDFFLDKLPKKW